MIYINNKKFFSHSPLETKNKIVKPKYVKTDNYKIKKKINLISLLSPIGSEEKRFLFSLRNTNIAIYLLYNKYILNK